MTDAGHASDRMAAGGANFNRFGAVGAAALLTLAPLGAAGGLGIAPIVALAALLTFPVREWAGMLRQGGASLVLAVVFFVYVAASFNWSRYAQTSSWQMWLLGVPCYLIVGAAVARGPEGNRLLVQRAGLAACVWLAGLLLVEALFEAPFYRLARGAAEDPGMIDRNLGLAGSVLVLLTWPSVAQMLRVGFETNAAFAKPVAAALIGAAALGGIAFGFDANLLALAAGGLAFIIARNAPRIGLWLTFGAAALSILLAPLFMPIVVAKGLAMGAALPPSWGARVTIWDYALARIAEKPVLGWGFDSARTFTETIPTPIGPGNAIPLHCHNAGLHVWLETGAVGAGLLALLLLFAGLRAAKHRADDPYGAAAIAATTAAFFVYLSLSYGIWQEWLLGLGALAGGYAVATGLLTQSARTGGTPQ